MPNIIYIRHEDVGASQELSKLILVYRLRLGSTTKNLFERLKDLRLSFLRLVKRVVRWFRVYWLGLRDLKRSYNLYQDSVCLQGIN